MSLRINHNVTSMAAQRTVAKNSSDLEKSVERLSSGLRINHSWDDPAGLGVSERLRAQIASLEEAERNANYGINLLATAEGALATIDEKLIRMRALSVEAANGTLSSLDRSYLDVEFQQLKSEVTRIASVTNYNGMNLLDGTYSSGSTNGGVRLQVGTGTTQNQDYYSVSLTAMTASSLGLNSADLTNTTMALSALTQMDSAIGTKDSERTRLGAFVTRLGYTISNLQIAQETATASESTIRDTDFAQEMAGFTRAQILMQSGLAMLAQANSMPNYVLQLL
ncbi:MAG: flagellin FliC [Calditrichaeota bacterium]|nr:flagellin FliC [Candidatus Cloacimonadota bacterium]MCB1047884.1 flagellin FliC [Calditrichota bacterium]MCB9475144.1 flagellin FliC [Candidatus Delongbacteria bacterium]